MEKKFGSKKSKVKNIRNKLPRVPKTKKSSKSAHGSAVSVKTGLDNDPPSVSVSHEIIPTSHNAFGTNFEAIIATLNQRNLRKSDSPDEHPSIEIQRLVWKTQLDFVMSCIIFSIGLGNIWRFPYLAYRNGGGSFLLCYLLSVVLAALPLYTLEIYIGQLSGYGPSKAFGTMAPVFQGLGWAMIIVSFLVSIYYNMVIAWCIFYLFASFTASTQWDNCRNEWNSKDCYSQDDEENCQKFLNDSEAIFFEKKCWNQTLAEFYNIEHQVNERKRRLPTDEFFNRYVLLSSADPDKSGPVSPKLAVSLLTAWVLVFFCVVSGLKATGKIIYVTAFVPYAILLLFFIRAITLPGSGGGLWFYLIPDVTLLSDFKIWKDAAIQAFYSLGPTFGCLTTMASYNPFHSNVQRDSLLVVSIDTFTSVFAGCPVFGVLGFLASSLNTTINEVTNDNSDVGIAFIAFPEIISRLPGSNIWSIFFFLMVITLSLDSQFIMVETVITALKDMHSSLRKGIPRMLLVGGICALSFTIGIIFCVPGGTFMFTIFDEFAVGYCSVVIAFLEICVVVLIYGLPRFAEGVELIQGFKPNYYWYATWLITTPCFTLFLFITILHSAKQGSYHNRQLLQSSQLMCWLISLPSLICIIGFGIYRIVINCKNKEKLINLVMPTKKWRPKERAEFALKILKQKEEINAAETGTMGDFDILELLPKEQKRSILANIND